MKKLMLLAVLAGAVLPAQAVQIETLTGDTKLACEAILCLSTSTRPTECSAALKRYFDIRHKKWGDTVRSRANFLKLCPLNNSSVNIEQLANLCEKSGKGFLIRCK